MPPGWKNHIGFAWKVFAVKPEAIAYCMSQAADLNFRLHVLAADRAHVGPAAFRQHQVHVLLAVFLMKDNRARLVLKGRA